MPISLDANATAPLDPHARAAMLAVLDLPVGNPSSVHAGGQAARGVIERARRQVALAIGARPSEIVLTSGATESNALAWRGVLTPLVRNVQRQQGLAPVALLTPAEHPSLRALAAELALDGVDVRELALDAQGRLDLDDLRTQLQNQSVALVSVQAVGSELGTIHPIAQIAQLVRDHGACLHTDAAQAWGRVPVDVAAWGADLISLSGHKIGGPAGTGALWVRRGVRLRPPQPGHQEAGLRAGTENVIGIAGLGAAAGQVAARLAVMPHLRDLRDRLWTDLQQGSRQRQLPAPQRFGPQAPADEAGHVLSVGWPGVTAQTLVMALDLAGVHVSAGSACASGTTEPSHLLQTLCGADPAGQARARQVVRLSLGPGLTDAQVGAAAQQILQTVQRVADARLARAG